MATVFPDFTTISRLRTPATEGEFYILECLASNLSSDYEIFFNPFLDGDRPDIVILKKGCCVIIVEVKDWNLSSYNIDANNKWFIHNSAGKEVKIKSPMAQVFHYKNNIYNLHIPSLGYQNIINKNFYKIISPFVYFHNATVKDLNQIYSFAFETVRNDMAVLNKDRRNMGCDEKCQQEYENRYIFLKSKQYKLERDFYMSFCRENVDKFIRKVLKVGSKYDVLFDDSIYNVFKRRLSPSEWTGKQGIPIEFTKEQKKYIKSIKGERKRIRGVSGCGKSMILGARALDAYSQHKNVLILTFNLTLRNLIRDRLSYLNYHLYNNEIDVNRIEISNYHHFFVSKLNEYGIEPDEGLYDPNLYIKRNIFKGCEIEKYDSIFIDEIQDYEKEWIYIIRDYFLAKDGEMVLWGDFCQNIYNREVSLCEGNLLEDKSPPPADDFLFPRIDGFGRWFAMTKSLRSKNRFLPSMFYKFQKVFLLNKYKNIEFFDDSIGILTSDIFRCNVYNIDDVGWIAEDIDKMMRQYKFIPNDTTILSSQKKILEEIEEFFSTREKVLTTFITKSEKRRIDMMGCRSEMERKVNLLHMERAKKYGFNLNSGVIKISTIQSFKGMENKNIFCIFNKDDSLEIIYTAITRASVNWVVYIEHGSPYLDFFEKMNQESMQ